jgi:hypothetical protein
MRKGEYLILNKKYSKEDYEALTEKIREHMRTMPYTDAQGLVYRYGEFFPVGLSMFAYNETIAQNFFPLSEREAAEKGYRWRETETKEYVVTLPAADLPDHIRDATDVLLNEINGCSVCGRGFKLIPAELALLRRMNVPLPRECPFCRINEKFTQWVKNLRVIPRTCSRCASTFDTGYTEEEAPYILCKKCYQSEVV